jgi:hypothetical protein
MTMRVLKLALLGSLRIVFLGSLKVALFVYALFLSDTSFAGAVTEGNGHSYGATGSNGNGKASRKQCLVVPMRAGDAN